MPDSPRRSVQPAAVECRLLNQVRCDEPDVATRSSCQPDSILQGASARAWKVRERAAVLNRSPRAKENGLPSWPGRLIGHWNRASMPWCCLSEYRHATSPSLTDATRASKVCQQPSAMRAARADRNRKDRLGTWGVSRSGRSSAGETSPPRHQFNRHTLQTTHPRFRIGWCNAKRANARLIQPK